MTDAKQSIGLVIGHLPSVEEIDQFCSSGCKYKAGAVKQQSVLDQRGDEVLSHSVSATPLGDEAAFMLTKVVVEANGNVVVDVRQPKGAELKEIMDQYSDLRHNPTFDLNFRTRYVVQAKENGSLVQLQIAAESSKYNPRTFIVGGMIKGKLEENLDILLSNY